MQKKHGSNEIWNKIFQILLVKSYVFEYSHSKNFRKLPRKHRSQKGSCNFYKIDFFCTLPLIGFCTLSLINTTVAVPQNIFLDFQKNLIKKFLRVISFSKMLQVTKHFTQNTLPFSKEFNIFNSAFVKFPYNNI